MEYFAKFESPKGILEGLAFDVLLMSMSLDYLIGLEENDLKIVFVDKNSDC
jgi:hypothetical protein